MQETLTIQQAAEYLHIHEVTAYEMASRGEIPGAKIGRAWVFHIDNLRAWLMEEIQRQTESRKGAGSQPKKKASTVKVGSRRNPLPDLPDIGH